MVPAHARGRHVEIIAREARIRDYLETSSISRWEPAEPGAAGAGIGVITAGACYPYVREVLPGAEVLKLGASWPLPDALVERFCSSVDRVIVVEELEPVIERELFARGFAVSGKGLFPRAGELSPELVRAGFEKAGVLAPRPSIKPTWMPQPIARPPVLCAGCPHTSAFMAVRATGARVAGDIGCYTLGALDPLRGLDTSVAMGCSIGVAAGMALAGETKPVLATIGDSTFLHSGIPPLIDAVYNGADITVMLLDNHITAMTGGQDHPGTGRTLRGDPAPRVDFEVLVRSLGVSWVRRVDSYDLADMHQVLRDAIAHRGVSVLISDRPCVIDPVKIKGPPLAIDHELCNACQSCMNLGCPALSWDERRFEGRHKVRIDPALCIGCSLCAQVCTVDCIKPTPERLS
ncbi:MAG: thiamine pyrophosphate-dependent enzyme [Burkholderiaceae bacterium]